MRFVEMIQKPNLAVEDRGAVALYGDGKALYVAKDGNAYLSEIREGTAVWFRLDMRAKETNPMLDRAIAELNSTEW